MTVTLEPWRTKPVTVHMVQFTGFGAGNGYAILAWLHDRGVMAVRDRDDIRLISEPRDDARAHPGYWFVVGTRDEVYAIRPDVQADKYERAAVAS